MKKWNVFFLLIFLTALFGLSEGRADETKYVGANWSDRYHYPSCKIAQKIRPEEIVTFASPEEAAAKGYVPCKKCNPPAPKGMAVQKTNFSHAFKKKAQDDSDS